MIRRILFGLALSVLGAIGAQAQTELSPDEARLAAASLLKSGHPVAARDITAVLVTRDPGDSAAWIIQTHAYRIMRDHPAAQASGRRAWATAENDIEKYGAALAMAQALSSDNKKTRAQIWLRRAVEVAPSDPLRARAVRDYRFVRMTNPWSVHLTFGLNPSDNVNNAPRDNTFVLGGLVFIDPTAVPLSGIEATLKTVLRRNLNVSQTRRDFVALRWDATHVMLTEDVVPAGVSASDFSYHRLQAQIGRDFAGGPDKPRQSIALSLGSIWTGGDHLANEIKVDWSELYTSAPERSFVWNTSIGYSDRKDNALRSGITTTLGAQWNRALPSGGQLNWRAEVGRTDTDSAALTHTRLEFGVSYTLPHPILGAVATVGLTGLTRRYDDPLYGPEARADTGASLSTSLLFKDFDTYGFAPKLTLTANRTSSNVTRFETQNFGLSIGFQSVF